jgi:hypothetical protein
VPLPERPDDSGKTGPGGFELGSGVPPPLGSSGEPGAPPEPEPLWSLPPSGLPEPEWSLPSPLPEMRRPSPPLEPSRPPRPEPEWSSDEVPEPDEPEPEDPRWRPECWLLPVRWLLPTLPPVLPAALVPERPLLVLPFETHSAAGVV